MLVEVEGRVLEFYNLTEIGELKRVDILNEVPTSLNLYLRKFK